MKEKKRKKKDKKRKKRIRIQIKSKKVTQTKSFKRKNKAYNQISLILNTLIVINKAQKKSITLYYIKVNPCLIGKNR